MTLPIAEDLERLTSRMLRKRLYVVVLAAKADAGQMEPFLAEHLEYMTQLARKGLLLRRDRCSEMMECPPATG
jgi:hypothetical protein